MSFVWHYRGFSIIPFGSIVMASTVLGTCGWILVANQKRSIYHPPVNNETDASHELRNGSSGNDTVDLSNCADSFRENFLRYCAITVIVAAAQLLTAIYLLISQPQEWRLRGKVWLSLNLFLNLVYFEMVIFLATDSKAINEYGERVDGTYWDPCIDKRTSSTAANYLSAFFISTILCFAFHYLSLILILILLKCLQGDYNGYSLVSLVPSE